MKFIIRDDDLSFYTDLKKLKDLYDPIFERGFRVSFATIPCERKVKNKNNRKAYKQIDEWRWLGENEDLIKYIKPKVQAGQIEIMLHGFDHNYVIAGDRFIGECVQKNKGDLLRDFSRGKKYLEELFGIEVLSFVPPSNQIDAKAIEVLGKVGIKNLSGAITPIFNRNLDLKNIFNWLKYVCYYVFNGRRYPYVLNNGTTDELTYYTLTTDLSKLKNDVDYCEEKGAPFVLAMHHWDLFEDDDKKEAFLGLLEYVGKKKHEELLFKNIF